MSAREVPRSGMWCGTRCRERARPIRSASGCRRPAGTPPSAGRRGRSTGSPPQPHRSVVAAARERLTVRAECNAENRSLVTAEGRAQCPVPSHVPEANGAVVACRGERLPVRAEGDAFHPVLVAHEGFAERFARAHAPEPHGAVDIARGERASIGAEGDSQRGPMSRTAIRASNLRRRTSHRRTVPSEPAVASVCPSGLNATLQMLPSWPRKRLAQRHALSMSQGGRSHRLRRRRAYARQGCNATLCTAP